MNTHHIIFVATTQKTLIVDLPFNQFLINSKFLSKI